MVGRADARRPRREAEEGPRGAPRFQSEPAAGGYSFKRKPKLPGPYEIVCTLHEEMGMTIKVRKR